MVYWHLIPSSSINNCIRSGHSTDRQTDTQAFTDTKVNPSRSQFRENAATLQLYAAVRINTIHFHIFKALALWADAFYKSIYRLSVCVSVCLCVYVSVHF